MSFSGDFSMERAGALYLLAREYHARCEAYDRTVCTGGTDRLGIVRPADARELGLINAHASQVRREVTEQAKQLGFEAQEVWRAIGKAA